MRKADDKADSIRTLSEKGKILGQSLALSTDTESSVEQNMAKDDETPV